MTPPSLAFGPCSVTSGGYLRAFAALYAAAWGRVVMAVAAVLAVMAWRWPTVVAGIVVAMLTVVVLAVPLLTYYYALSTAALWSVMEKSIAADSEGLTFTFTHPRMTPKHLPWTEVRRAVKTSDNILLVVRRPKGAVLLIPRSNFTENNCLEEQFIKLIAESLAVPRD